MVKQTNGKTPGPREGRGAVHQDGSQGTLLGRVGASTSALLQEAIRRPRPENLTASLASSSARSTKGESPSGPSNVSGSSSHHLQEHACQSHATIPHFEDQFRSQHPRLPDLSKSANSQFDTFITTSNHFPEGILVYNNLLDAPTRYRGKGKMPEEEDGAAVVKLLSDPNFSIDELADVSSGPEPVEELTNFLKIDERTRQILARLKADLPPASVHQIPSPNNPLNLLPNFNNHSRVSRKEETVSPGTAQISGSYLHCTPPVTQTHVEPWLGVLTNYQDEVWGDLLPLVHEAREEVRNAMKEGNTALKDCPAVTRLGMILGHIEPPKSR